MIVKDLIEKLKEFPEDLEVKVHSEEYGEDYDLDGRIKIIEEGEEKHIALYGGV